MEFVIVSICLWVFSFFAFWFISYAVYDFGIDLLKNRYIHHFMAGMYGPYLLLLAGRKLESTSYPFITYLAVCLVWESGQYLLIDGHCFQWDQLFWDITGIIVIFLLSKKIRYLRI
ncbi:MAG: hypothetical protein CR971_00175 [candidate division SR1 bacterium]|nr:MAG: hypothetical protein CR971_00175 [candidate division SR1 bacterium]